MLMGTPDRFAGPGPVSQRYALSETPLCAAHLGCLSRKEGDMAASARRPCPGELGRPRRGRREVLNDGSAQPPLLGYLGPEVAGGGEEEWLRLSSGH
jgi:hypothetical protein